MVVDSISAWGLLRSDAVGNGLHEPGGVADVVVSAVFDMADIALVDADRGNGDLPASLGRVAGLRGGGDAGGMENTRRRVQEKAESGEKSAVTGNLPALVWMDGEWRAFVEEAEWLKKAGVELVVVEGDVNPVLHNEQRTEMRAEFERRMAEGVEKGLWRFVGEEELDAGIVAEDWADMTHVNAVGREKLTKAFGRVLGEQ